MHHLIIGDVETASLRYEDGIVEKAWLEIDDDLSVLNEVRSLIKPPGAISAGASGVHGITADDVQDSPNLDEFWQSLGNPFKDRRVLLIAHNAAFDAKYFAPYIGELETLCTLKLARIAFPKDTEGQPDDYVPPDDHKLQTLMFYLGLKKKGTHNALDDVYTCLELLRKISEKLNLDLEGLYHLANKPIEITGETKMPFGKHKGTKLKDLDSGYVRWLLTKCDNLDPDLRGFLERNP